MESSAKVQQWRRIDAYERDADAQEETAGPSSAGVGEKWQVQEFAYLLRKLDCAVADSLVSRASEMPDIRSLNEMVLVLLTNRYTD